MFAIFSKETALPPPGLLGLDQALRAEFKYQEPEVQDLATSSRKSSELKRQCSDTLNCVHGKHKESRVLELGGGNGFLFSASPFCHCATGSQVSCLFSGQVTEWPGLNLMAENHNAYVTGVPEDAHDEASWLLAFYSTIQNLACKGITDEALQRLANIQGRFAFVMYDATTYRVLAARDRRGVQQLFWGSTEDGRLMFGSDLADLADCKPSATAFPAGSLFMSEIKAKAIQPGKFGWMIDNHVIPGEIFSFVPRSVPAPLAPFRGVKAVPRVTSKGCLCGAVYRVASESNIVDWEASH